MRVIEDHVTRERVLRTYAEYDRRKKGQGSLPSDMNEWPWDDAIELDSRLKKNHLKDGVLAAYRDWRFVEIGLTDFLECAIYNGIFPGQPQALCQLVLLGQVAAWSPDRDTEWLNPIRGGADFTAECPFILRPSLTSEAPAKWYIEDGSGRALAFLQRALRWGELDRTAWAYLGIEPDKCSPFIKSRPELWNRGYR
jgi:hypothetical protein